LVAVLDVGEAIGVEEPRIELDAAREGLGIVGRGVTGE
jgi:hypothetical protein